jgi:hypothetical protein
MQNRLKKQKNVIINKEEYLDSVYNELYAIQQETPTTLDEWISFSNNIFKNHRKLYKKIGKCFVTENTNTEEYQKKIIFLANARRGPKIMKTETKGYGLFADKYYEKYNIEVIYHGNIVDEEKEGDYIVWNTDDNFGIDGLYNYRITAKGRWINEPTGNQKENMSIDEWDYEYKKCSITNTIPVNKGDELLLDYGKSYKRPWLNVEYNFYI